MHVRLAPVIHFPLTTLLWPRSAQWCYSVCFTAGDTELSLRVELSPGAVTPEDQYHSGQLWSATPVPCWAPAHLPEPTYSPEGPLLLEGQAHQLHQAPPRKTRLVSPGGHHRDRDRDSCSSCQDCHIHPQPSVNGDLVWGGGHCLWIISGASRHDHKEGARAQREGVPGGKGHWRRDAVLRVHDKLGDGHRLLAGELMVSLGSIGSGQGGRGSE